jgi:hypothetical protein
VGCNLVGRVVRERRQRAVGLSHQPVAHRIVNMRGIMRARAAAEFIREPEWDLSPFLF